MAHSRSLVDSPGAALADQLRVQINKQSNGNPLDLSHPSNMYLVREQAECYLKLMKDEAYSAPFHDPVKRLFEKFANKLVGDIEDPVALIDLGPGNPDKTLPLFDFLKSAGKPFVYIPVDISQYFLKLATDLAKAAGVKVRPLNCLFEELPERLPGLMESCATQGAVIVFGLTFMNYSPEAALSLLRELRFLKDRIVVATELRQGADDSDLIRPYMTSAADTFNFQVLRTMGFERKDFDYTVSFIENRVEMGFVSRNRIKSEDFDLTLPEATKVITAVSFRYTRFEFEHLFAASFKSIELIFDNCSHVAIAALGAG